MSLFDIWFLYRARVRARSVLVQEGFAIVGIAVGVALLFASQVAATSLTHSVTKMTRQIVGDTQFQLDARGPSGFDERLLSKVRAVPGVGVALPVVEQQASVIGPHRQRSIELIGADPRFAHFGGPLLRRFSARQLVAQKAIALPETLAHELEVGPLETVTLQIGARLVPTLVGAMLTEADIGELSHSPVAVAPVHYVQNMAGLSGRVTRIFIKTQRGLNGAAERELRRLAQAAGVNLEPANFDATLFAVAAAPATQSQTLFSAISALVGFMFAFNAMLMTVPSRRRLLQDVRRQGATRFMVIQLLMFDAAVLGLMACIVGLALGDLLSVLVFHATPGYLSLAFAIGNERTVTWTSVALAVLCGLTAAALGVFWPLRDIIACPFGSDESSNQTKRGVSHIRLAVGIAGIVVTALIIILHPASAILGCFTLLTALVCLLPPLFDLTIEAFDRLQTPLHRTSTILAVTELRTPQTRVRSLAIAATGSIALFGVVAVHGAQTNLISGLDRTTRGIDSGADLWLLPRGGTDTFLTVPFKAIDVHAIARIPGIKALAPYRGSFLNWGDRRIWIRAVPALTRDPVPPGELVNGDQSTANSRLRAGGWIVVSKGLASALGLKVGERFLLPSPRPVVLRVAALSTNLGWTPGTIILSSSDYARAWNSQDPSAYQIQLIPGANSMAVSRNIERVAGPGLTVEAPSERNSRNQRVADQGLSRLTDIRTLILIAAVLAVAGAMAAMIWQRRDLVAFIKCQGYRRGVLWRWLMCECGLLLTVGCVIGALFGLFGQLLLSHALAVVTGFPISFHIGAVIAFWSFALVTIAAIALVAIAGYLVVRVPPRTVSPAY